MDPFHFTYNKSFKEKLDFLKSQKELKTLQISFWSRKRNFKSIDLFHFFDNDYIDKNTDIVRDIQEIKSSSSISKNLPKEFKFGTAKKAFLFPINTNNKVIGAIFLPFLTPPSPYNYSLIENFKNQIEHYLTSKDFEKKLSKANKELNHKLLEIESLIDITEIINDQEEIKQNLFENILATMLSILNSSKGMILLKDEKSGFFNVISQLNILNEELPKKIIRITKGILKELNDEKQSKIIDKPHLYELLKASSKNSIVSPIISENKIVGVIILFDKESRKGIIRFNQQDLRLFDSLTKKVSLAYDNIRLIDSLKSSNKLVQNIMSSITTGIIMINILGEIEFVNQSAEKIFGRDDIINNHYFMVFQKNPELIDKIQKAEIDNEIIYEDNFKIIDKDEKSIEINLTLSPVYDEQNERSGIVFSFEDLSSINKVKSTFKKYVSENIVDELLQDDKSLELGGSQNEVCVLFCDIRGFTSLSEKMKPTEVVYLLNSYFQTMIDVVFSHNGTLDKIIGDELMVLYGVPLRTKNDSQSAVDSAIAMLQALNKFNKVIEKENLPKLHVGIGINYGKVVSGNIGSERQMNYTVIGDAVNLAARLCSHAKAGQIVISKSVFEKLENSKGFKKQQAVNVKGKSKPIDNWIYKEN